MILKFRVTLILLAFLAAGFAFYTSDDDRRLAGLMLATAFGQVACLRQPVRGIYGPIPVALFVLAVVMTPDGGWGFGIADYPVLIAITTALTVFFLSDPPRSGSSLGVLLTAFPALLFLVFPGLIDYNFLGLSSPSTAILASMLAALFPSLIDLLVQAKRTLLWHVGEWASILILTWFFDQVIVQSHLL